MIGVIDSEFEGLSGVDAVLKRLPGRPAGWDPAAGGTQKGMS
jgi:hypothetical protein